MLVEVIVGVSFASEMLILKALEYDFPPASVETTEIE